MDGWWCSASGHGSPAMDEDGLGRLQDPRKKKTTIELCGPHSQRPSQRRNPPPSLARIGQSFHSLKKEKKIQHPTQIQIRRRRDDDGSPERRRRPQRRRCPQQTRRGLGCVLPGIPAQAARLPSGLRRRLRPPLRRLDPLPLGAPPPAPPPGPPPWPLVSIPPHGGGPLLLPPAPRGLLFFWKREVLLILDNYIKMIQLYKICPSCCITKMHTAYEKGTKKERENAMT